MENKIKVGDKVRVVKDVPKMYMHGYGTAVEYHVCEIEGDAVAITCGHDVLTIPTKYLIKVDTEEKYRVGDKVVVHYSIGDRIGRIQEVMMDGTYDIVFVDGCTEHNITRSSQIEPYSEPTEQTEAENQAITLGEWVVTPYGYGVVGKDIEGRIAVALEYGGFCGIDKAIKIIADNPVFDWDTYAADIAKEMEGCDNIVSIKEKIRNLHRENNQGLHFNPFRCNNFANAVGESDYWKHYASNLAKEVALKVSYKYTDPKEAAEYAVLVAKAVVEELKRK